MQKELEESIEWERRYEEIYAKNIEVGLMHNIVTFIFVTTLFNFDILDIC